LGRVNPTIDSAIEAINLAAAYCFCFSRTSKLLLDQVVSPPCLQSLADLDNVFLQLVSLRDNELLCTTEDSLALG
jgi:hypothetical protein